MKKVKRNSTYERMSMATFFGKYSSERSARELIWSKRFGKSGFKCPSCGSEEAWELKSRPEVKQCSCCHQQVRARAGTMFENSKLPLLVWIRAIFLVMQDKRGVSALALQRQLGLTRYETAWNLLLKIRTALAQRDEKYQLSEIVELDGAFFGRKENNNQASVFIAVERKNWVDQKGKTKSRAGFAKVCIDELGEETKATAMKFVEKSIRTGSEVRTDKRNTYRNLQGVKVKQNSSDKFCDVKQEIHLPWLHRFVSNAKAWVLGTHHGVSKKYMAPYLAEYTYRFNRRHDTKSLFSRAFTACLNASPKTLPALTG